MTAEQQWKDWDDKHTETAEACGQSGRSREAYKAALRKAIEALEKKKENHTNFISVEDNAYNDAIDACLQLLDTVTPE